MVNLPSIRSEGLRRSRDLGLLALAVFVLEEAVSALVFLSMRSFPVLRGSLLLPSATFLTHWLIPLLIVFFVERRGASSIGFTVRGERRGVYGLYALVGLGLPALVVGMDRMLVIDFLEQIVQIGVAEEVFFRGYLLHRLLAWLGNPKGLTLGALTFGFAHILSRLCQHGLQYPLHDLTLGLQTFLGGIVIGLIYLRARSIVPGAILHVSANLYLQRLIHLLG